MTTPRGFHEKRSLGVNTRPYREGWQLCRTCQLWHPPRYPDQYCVRCGRRLAYKARREYRHKRREEVQ